MNDYYEYELLPAASNSNNATNTPCDVPKVPQTVGTHGRHEHPNRKQTPRKRAGDRGIVTCGDKQKIKYHKTRCNAAYMLR